MAIIKHKKRSKAEVIVDDVNVGGNAEKFDPRIHGKVDTEEVG